jgi:mono/diheme cytochrome c family protein
MSRIQIEITLGIIMVMVTSAVLIYVGLNEESRMARFELAHSAQAIEVGATLYQNNCSSCHGPRGQGNPGLAPALNDPFFFDGRMQELGWGGTLEDYVISTVSTGRVVSTRPEYIGGGRPAMPAWSDHYGGPLRDDQIRSLAAFVMNWESAAGEGLEPIEPVEPVGIDITRELPEGDASRGELVAAAQGCVACHISTPAGPAWNAGGTQPGIGARAETRFSQADYTGQAENAYQYLFESIVQPGVYLVEGYTDVMPHNYGDVLSPQDLADLIAYLLTFR